MKGFLKTVMVVTVFSVCEKFLGFLYRIYLSRSIGAEGVGLYQVSLSVFAFLLTLTCSGTPITVSRLMTKYKAEKQLDKEQKVISAGIIYTLIIALSLCILFYIFNSKLSFIFADDRCIKIFLIVLPGLVFTSIYSIFRGVFWGNKDFLPYSVIELLEEICMIIFGILLISNSTTIFDGAVRAGVAVLISYIFSFTLASIVFFFRKNKIVNPGSEFKPLIKTATPINAMRTINSLSISLVSIILPFRLMSIGLTESSAMSLYGIAVGQAVPLICVPSTLIGSFILVLVPEISTNFYNKNNLTLKTDIEKAIKFTMLLSCLFIPIFFVCGEEIGVLIFDSPECGKYLTVSSFIVAFMGLSNITASLLDSLGKEKSVLIFCLIGGLLMLLSVYILPKLLGIYALIVGFCFTYGLTAILNIITLIKVCPIKLKFIKSAILSIVLTLPTIVFGIMLEKLLLPLLGTFLTFFICSLIMVIFMGLLYVGFNLVSFNVIIKKLKIKNLPIFREIKVKR